MPSSRLYKGEPIINDTTPIDVVLPPDGRRKGLSLPPASRRSYAGVAEPFPDELLIPRSEWEERIKESEKRKSRNSDLAEQAGLPCKDQSNTNLCWINAPTHCFEITRVVQNQAMVIFSPASAGGPIKNFRNVGGWGREGLEWIVERGLVPISRWPANAIDRRYYTEENRQIALKYRVQEWWVCQPRNLDQMVSSLLRGFCGASGLNWWGHEVTYYELVWLDGQVAVRQRNSWGMGWGSKGYGILQGSRMLPDDYVVPRVAIAA